jgi:hypothetical protein
MRQKPVGGDQSHHGCENQQGRQRAARRLLFLIHRNLLSRTAKWPESAFAAGMPPMPAPMTDGLPVYQR